MGDKSFNIKDLTVFYEQLIKPECIPHDILMVNQNQVAGHAGFYSLRGSEKVCLKPFNPKCVRGRREHFFYQLMELFRYKQDDLATNDHRSERSEQLENELYYRYFQLLNPPDSFCNCIISGAFLRAISQFIPKFYHVRYKLHSENLTNNSLDLNKYKQTVYSEDLICPCYGRNAKEKSTCSSDYEKTNFLCLEDLTSHCQAPCIIDIKIGPVTYDPMAIKEKVLEQSSKYRQLREFGFRILGMKVGPKLYGKSHGKTLETPEQVQGALERYLEPLNTNEQKHKVIRCILDRLYGLAQVFVESNLNQLKFFSSSLLIVYDMAYLDKPSGDVVRCRTLAETVRVYMIDFAHVFHVHSENQTQDSTDSNYLFGLERLSDFFLKIDQQLI